MYAEHIGQQTFLIFMSLVVLIFANVALPPKKEFVSTNPGAKARYLKK
ncbi:hypothetical protein ACOBV8_21050 (plasmid) [Pseudoalteromonas espejiana]